MPDAVTNTLGRKQLDRMFSENTNRNAYQRPNNGWIREVRDVLGMSARQLAIRMGIAQATAAKLERSERSGTITLNSLRKAADAMDCTLTYAFLPRRSLETLVQERAERLAREIVGKTVHTMTLEDQTTTIQQQKEHIQELAAELVRTMNRQIWEDVS